MASTFLLLLGMPLRAEIWDEMSQLYRLFVSTFVLEVSGKGKVPK